MSRVLRCALLVTAAIWWGSTIAVGFALVGAFHLNIWRIVRRARRLRLAGRFDDAAAMLEQARRETVEEQSGGR